MKKFLMTLGIGFLEGFLISLLFFSLAIFLLAGVGAFDKWTITLIKFYSSVGSIFGIIGALIGGYAKKSQRWTWIGGLTGTLISIGLIILLFITIPCPMLGGC